MIKKLLIYNSGGGIGDSVQLLPLINTLKNELKETKFYYLSSHDNHFNSTLKDFNCSIENLNLEIKYFGFRWWHVFATKSKVKRNNIDFFDVIIDLQTKFRNSIILKSIPHKYFVSSSLNFLLSNPISKQSIFRYCLAADKIIKIKKSNVFPEVMLNNIIIDIRTCHIHEKRGLFILPM